MNRLYTILLLAFGHGINDIYPGLLSPLLPVFIDRYGWSLAQAGILVTVLQIFSNLSQPVIAVFNDRRPTRAIMWAGLLIAAVPFCFMLQVSMFPAVAFMLAVSGLGAGMYHTPGVTAAGRVAAGRGHGSLMGIFTAGGLIGFTVAPLIAVFFIEIIGDRYMPLVLLPALATAILIAFDKTIPLPKAEMHTLGEWASSLVSTGPKLAILWLVSALRDTTSMLVGSFLMLVLMERGYSYVQSSIILSIQVLTGVFFMIFGGHLSDIRGRKKILAICLFLISPLLFGFLSTSGMLSLAFLFLAMGATYATVPITILLAQKAAPNHASTASSMVMGLSFAIGSVLATPFGMLADRIGIESAMMSLVALPMLGCAGVLLIKK